MVKKIALIGWGHHSSSWIQRINRHPDWELSAIVDTDTEKMGNIPEVLCDPDEGYITLDDLVKFGEKPDAVLIATPIPTHHTLAIDALDYGINVICEKNMAYTLSQGKQMVKAAQRHPELVTAVGTQYRFFQDNWAIKAFMDQTPSPIGNLGMVNVSLAGGGTEERNGWRRHMEDIYLQDMAVHYIDLIRYWTKMDFVEVSAMAFVPNYSNWKGTSSLFMNFTLAKQENYENEDEWVRGRFYGDWQKKGPGESRYEFIGDKGAVLNLPNQPWSFQKFASEGGKTETTPIDERTDVYNNTNGYEGHSFLLENFKDAIDSKGKISPYTNFQEGFKSFAVLMAAKQSYEQKKTINVPDLWKDLGI
jgi:predicted dehydrogenase